MPADMLVRAVDTGKTPKGAIVAVCPFGWEWGSAEALPNFVRVHISDGDFSELAAFRRPWWFDPDIEVVSVSAGTATLRITNAVARGSDGRGAVTQGSILSVLSAWNAVVTNTDANEVVCTISVFAAATSPGFWNANVANIVFTDLGFAGGVQTIDADYSALSIHPNEVALRVIRMGGDVLSNSEGVVRISMPIANLRRGFREDMHNVSTLVDRSRWRFAEASVDQAIAAGGEVTITRAQALANLVDAATL